MLLNIFVFGDEDVVEFDGEVMVNIVELLFEKEVLFV